METLWQVRVPSRGGLNFCVPSTPLREAGWGGGGGENGGGGDGETKTEVPNQRTEICFDIGQILTGNNVFPSGPIADNGEPIGGRGLLTS